MTVEDNLSLFGSNGFFSNEFLIGQLGLFTITILLFVSSIALCVMAMRSAASARRMQNEASDLFAAQERQVAELRAMSADVERASADIAERHEAFTAQLAERMPVRELSGETVAASPEPSKGPVVRRFDNAEEPEVQGDAELDEEPHRKPSAFLSGIFRRR
ncbi:MAG: hypothetical protein AAFW68_10830 [Pseudomonadota bacterium]